MAFVKLLCLFFFIGFVQAFLYRYNALSFCIRYRPELNLYRSLSL